jgi:hypothetical protein
MLVSTIFISMLIVIYADCHIFMLNVVFFNVMLDAVLLNVVLLSVIAPFKSGIVFTKLLMMIIKTFQIYPELEREKVKFRRHHTQYNDSKHNDILHKNK